MYTIKKVSEKLGISIETIRYYEEVGLITPYKNQNNGYRYYDEFECRKIVMLKRLRSYGCSIELCKTLLLKQDSLKAYDQIMEKQLQELNNQAYLIERKKQAIGEMKDEWQILKKEPVFEEVILEECYYLVNYRNGYIETNEKILKKLIDNIPLTFHFRLNPKESILNHVLVNEYCVGIKKKDLEIIGINSNQLKYLPPKKYLRIYFKKKAKDLFDYDLIKRGLDELERREYVLDGDIISKILIEVIEDNELFNFHLVYFPYREK